MITACMVGLLNSASASPSVSDRLAVSLRAAHEWTQEEKTAGLKKSEFTRYVPSGVERRLDFLYAIKLDCSSQGVIIVRTIQQPDHGTVEIVQSEGFPTFAADSRYAKCNDQTTSGVLVKYKSSDDYVGADSFKILAMYPNGLAREALYKINVR